LVKIAIDLWRALERRRTEGNPGRTTPRILASGDGWRAADVLCTCGPQDRPFEEQHAYHSIAVVLAGSFQYRASPGSGLMAPGSLMLGNPGQCFECGHEHGDGDRCVAFWYAPDYFDRLAADAGHAAGARRFDAARLPPLRSTAPLVARAGTGAIEPDGVAWEELAVELAAQAMNLAARVSNRPRPPSNAEARVTRTIRMIDRRPDGTRTLGRLARDAGLSPYHFLRTFEQVTGVTPHQYILRARLREAAVRLAGERGSVLSIALDCGFGDVSNFNRAFRTEFGVTPRAYRQRARTYLTSGNLTCATTGK
jgi:AraC-like DNA-binding protein